MVEPKLGIRDRRAILVLGMIVSSPVKLIESSCNGVFVVILKCLILISSISVYQFIYLKVIIVALERNRCTRLVISAVFQNEPVICFEHAVL